MNIQMQIPKSYSPVVLTCFGIRSVSWMAWSGAAGLTLQLILVLDTPVDITALLLPDGFGRRPQKWDPKAVSQSSQWTERPEDLIYGIKWAKWGCSRHRSVASSRR